MTKHFFESAEVPASAGREVDAIPPPSAGQAVLPVVESRASSVPPKAPAAGVNAAVPGPHAAATTGANPDAAELL